MCLEDACAWMYTHIPDDALDRCMKRVYVCVCVYVFVYISSLSSFPSSAPIPIYDSVFGESTVEFLSLV